MRGYFKLIRHSNYGNFTEMGFRIDVSESPAERQTRPTQSKVTWSHPSKLTLLINHLDASDQLLSQIADS